MKVYWYSINSVTTMVVTQSNFFRAFYLITSGDKPIYLIVSSNRRYSALLGCSLNTGMPGAISPVF